MKGNDPFDRHRESWTNPSPVCDKDTERLGTEASFLSLKRASVKSLQPTLSSLGTESALLQIRSKTRTSVLATGCQRPTGSPSQTIRQGRDRKALRLERKREKYNYVYLHRTQPYTHNAPRKVCTHAHTRTHALTASNGHPKMKLIKQCHL